MTQQVMIEILYKAIADAGSKLIKSGTAIIILLGVCGGLTWGLFYTLDIHRQDRREWKAELLEVKKEYSEEITRLRIEVYECQQRNANLSAQLARMEERLNRKR